VKYTNPAVVPVRSSRWRWLCFSNEYSLFHVEQGIWGRYSACPCRWLGSGDQYLRPILLQPAQDQALVAAIQLRGEVVQRHDRPLAALPGLVLGLGQQGRQGSQLGLSARQRLPARDPGMLDPPVGAMRADRGEAGGQVAVAGQQQGLT
jgi:hypothetical protein